MGQDEFPQRLGALANGLSDDERLQVELAALKAERARLAADLEAATARLSGLEQALEPRLKSILSLRPLRYALGCWLAAKRKTRGSAPAPDAAECAVPLEGSTQPPQTTDWDGLGVALFGHTRVQCLRNALESLARQDALHITHVFIDGDQGDLVLRDRIDRLCDGISHYPVKKVHRQQSRFGFRKMMLTAGDYMRANHERIVFLEDDCFPAHNAIAEFNRELNLIENDESVFSVYGHHFLTPGEEGVFPRFQSWGWATTAGKLAPVWEELRQCYLMSEPEYRAFVEERLSKDIARRIDVTPGRQPTDVLRRFFAWDETVCLLAALRGQGHKRSDERLVYNCGAGLEATHFDSLRFFRKPPFNMIGADEVWRHY